jgi:5-methylcytosine-specific restriction endonuclease McrA
MSIENPNAQKHGRPSHKPILRSEIEEAQRHTKSNKAAARYLNVHYDIYKRYAKLYDLFDSHMNPAGVGIDKGYSHRASSIPLRDILEGKHPNYSRAKLKNRLLARKKLEERCTLCGFDERRITDKKTPLILTHADGNQENFQLDNLELLCYNCMFLTTGAPTVAYRRHIERSFESPESIPSTSKKEVTAADYHDIEDREITAPENNYLLSEEEKRALLKELRGED